MLVIFTIIAMVVSQFVVGMFWYGKYMFGNLFLSLNKIDFSSIDKKDANASYIKQIFATIVKSVIFYYAVFLTYSVENFIHIYVIIFITLLIVIKMYEQTLWLGNKSMKLFLLNASHEVVITLIGFAIALFSISLI